MRSAVAAWIVSSTTIFSTSADDNVARNRTEISRAKGKHRRMVTPPRMCFYCLAKRDLTKTLKSAVNKNSDQYETVETGSGYVHRSEPKPKAQSPKPVSLRSRMRLIVHRQQMLHRELCISLRGREAF